MLSLVKTELVFASSLVKQSILVVPFFIWTIWIFGSIFNIQHSCQPMIRWLNTYSPSESQIVNIIPDNKEEYRVTPLSTKIYLASKIIPSLLILMVSLFLIFSLGSWKLGLQ